MEQGGNIWQIIGYLILVFMKIFITLLVGSMDFQQDESGIVLVELDMKFKRKDWEHLHEV